MSIHWRMVLAAAACGLLANEVSAQQPVPSVDGIEVVQVVQDMAHSVPLVAGKPTWVRAYLSVPQGSLTVRALITAVDVATGQRTDVLSSKVELSLPETGSYPLRARREHANLSANALLPGALTATGKRRFGVEWIVNESGIALACSNCGQQSVPIEFVDAPPLRLRVIGLRYSANTGGAILSYTPRITDYSSFVSWVDRVFPTSRVTSSYDVIDALVPVEDLNCTTANAQLAAIRAQELSEAGTGADTRVHYIGLVSDEKQFVRGCSSGLPVVADPSVVATVPAGDPARIPRFGKWDKDDTYADWYGAHELAHTFGLRHVGGCDDRPVNPNYPYNPGGFLSKQDGAFVGVDRDTNGALRVYPGRGWTDIMTYCDNEWPSDYTYRRLFDRLKLEDARNFGGQQANDNGGAPTTLPEPANDDEMEGPKVSPSYEQGTWLHVVATVNLTKKTAVFLPPIPVVNGEKEGPPPAASMATLRLLRDDGGAIQDVPVWLRRQSDPDTVGTDTLAMVSVVVSRSPDLHKLELRRDGVLLGSLILGVSRPSLQVTRPKAAAGPVTIATERAIWRTPIPATAAVQGTTVYTVLVRGDTGSARVVRRSRLSRGEIDASVLGNLREGWIIVVANNNGIVSRDSTFIRKP